VVIDESLTDLETLLLAREMGYTRVALKACKGQSQAMLMAAAAQKFGMFLCVQDLTCPGASLIHSAGIAARVPGTPASRPMPGSSFRSRTSRGRRGSRSVHDSRRCHEHGTADRIGAGRGAPRGGRGFSPRHTAALKGCAVTTPMGPNACIRTSASPGASS
jgi:hypothetical protein